MNVNTPGDKISLNNGYSIPCIGFGTYKTPEEEVCDAVKTAVQAGYRHIDTASYYFNESGVGRAVRECGIPREELFVTSKVWNTERGYDKTMASFEASMNALDLEYLDLFLIHWPANYLQFGKEAKTINADTWRALETLYRDGRVKAIGLSNFMAHHIEDLLETATVKPMVNQIELHPGWLQAGVLRYCADNGIVTEAWSPMGRSAILTHETIVSLAKKYNHTPAQLCIRWVMQHDTVPLPKSVTPERIRSNLDVFDFTISQEDMSTIDALDMIGGHCARPDDTLR